MIDDLAMIKERGTDNLLRMTRWTLMFIIFCCFVQDVLCDIRSIQGENFVQPFSENCETDDCQRCKPGYFGETCSQKCLFCKNQACNKVTGLCTTACKDGYYFGANGTCVKCTENCKTCLSEVMCSECEPGYKGTLCQEYCENCILGNACEQVTGYCLDGCKNGISGKYCNVTCASECASCERLNKFQCLTCSAGRYGEKCELSCSQTCKGSVCNRINGSCEKGCIDDFYGRTCEHRRLSPKTIVVIVTIVTAASGIIIVVVIGTLIYRRWKRRRLKRFVERSEYLVSGAPCISLTLNDEDIHPYEDVGNISVNEQFLKSGIPKSEQKNCVQVKQEDQYRAEFKQLKSLSKETSKKETSLQRTEKNPTLSLIDGYADKRAYIVYKDPTETFCCAFWHLVWQEKCNKVVILSGTSEEGETTHRPFLPKDGEQMTFGEINVDASKLKPLHFDSYDIREFDVKMGEVVRIVKYYQFKAVLTGEDEKEAKSLVEFCKAVTASQEKECPLLVLRRDGETHSGLFIAVDILGQELQNHDCVNVLKCVKYLHKQRLHVIRNVEQYKFLHSAVLCMYDQRNPEDQTENKNT